MVVDYTVRERASSPALPGLVFAEWKEVEGFGRKFCLDSTLGIRSGVGYKTIRK